MYTENIYIPLDQNPDHLFELLCGKVFHVTKSRSYHRIIKAGAILNNKSGASFGFENTGTCETSFSITKGYVSFFDLRDKHHEYDRAWIDKWLLGKYHIFTRPHFRTCETDEVIKYDMVFLTLKDQFFHEIIDYNDLREGGVDTFAYQLMPYVECWIDKFQRWEVNMTKKTTLRIIGGLILFFNLWLIGAYNLSGLSVLLLTFGFAIVYEYIIIRSVLKKHETENKLEEEMKTEQVSTLPKKLSVWNYIWIGIAVFMLLFLFLPQVLNGTLENIYYLGAVLWVGVIIYCFKNISKSKAQNNGKK